jgi:hypothetical protein
LSQEDFIWAIVAARDTALLNAKPRPTILIKLLSEYNSFSDSVIIMKLARSGHATVMVESPQYFKAFRHVLSTLQVQNYVCFF